MTEVGWWVQCLTQSKHMYTEKVKTLYSHSHETMSGLVVTFFICFSLSQCVVKVLLVVKLVNEFTCCTQRVELFAKICKMVVEFSKTSNERTVWFKRSFDHFDSFYSSFLIMLPNMIRTNISCDKIAHVVKITSRRGVETPGFFHTQRRFLPRVGKFPGTVSLRLCGAQAECRQRVGGDWVSENEWERSRNGERGKKRRRDIKKDR